ncbi:MAG: 54S ribosomal protein L2 mitochondrial [Pleopsidium flavum]|nr:MAG: 54S ribosomal protein L2 mitochondrial [Pleopsidium flavum]
MLLPRIRPPSQGLLQALTKPLPPSKTSINHLPTLRPSRTPNLTLTHHRHASHQTQGRANGAKDGPGKRLGAKKSGEQYVIPGNIIFRQRGTHWFAGDNCGMGRDHTIYATETGYVKYYKDPERHPKRKYIGVVFERGDVLPLPRNAARRRRLGMVGVVRDGETVAAEEEIGLGGVIGVVGAEREVVGKGKVALVKRELKIRPGYMYREANWEIGRAAERAKVKVKAFKPGDRFTAWRKTVARRARTAQNRAMRRK